MSSYFDAAVTEIAAVQTEEEDAFMEVLESVEARVIRDVNLVTGDREFPDDLRGRIQLLIVEHAVRPSPNLWHAKPDGRARRARSSRLIEELHDAFHDVARRRHETRFGRLMDDPAYILELREDHDIGGEAECSN